MNPNITQIEANVQKIVQDFQKDTFIYDLILAYGFPKNAVTLLLKGNANLSKVAGEIEWKKKLFFKAVSADEDLNALFETLKTHKLAIRHDPRFIIVTNFETLLARDTKTGDTLDIPILEMAKHVNFFGPWAGMETFQIREENPADVKAAMKMAKLYADIRKDNPENADAHDLNIFLSRLLFCFFAEDTGIFDVPNQFTAAVVSTTQPDGSDLNTFLDRLFGVLNTPPQYRTDLPAFLDAFKYVNGGLFRNVHKAPVFTRRSRQTLIDCGGEDWSAINPDIFGSMMQGVISTEQRGNLGMHYTSVPNIMKVIEPLFLNDLKEALENAKGNLKKLTALLQRLWHIKIFDPACGSGNFLIIAYKEMRQFEMAIFKEIDRVNGTYSNQFSGIALSNFYGIEIDDFAHELAILSLWLAEHQMNQAFFKAFGVVKPALPLMQSGHIVQGNATRLNWAEICPHTEGGEVFVLGNPPYLGSRNQDEIQKEDMKAAFGKDYKSLDYIACWLIKGSDFIKNSNAQFAFVSTNSICQGEQVALIWRKVLHNDLEISFAHKSFKWSNNAKDKAAVIVVIVGIRNASSREKRIYLGDKYIVSSNISPYLTSGNAVYVTRRSKPLSNVPECTFGSMPNDGGNLLLNKDEKNIFLQNYPQYAHLIKKFLGAQDFINGTERWCFVIDDDKLEEVSNIEFIAKRLLSIKKIRENSTESSTRKLAETPHKFYFFAHKSTDSIIIPRVSSERREYIPLGFLNDDTVISDSANAIYDADLWIFAVLTSRMHMTWVRAVCGRLKTDYRYSSSLVYNNFPMPPLSILEQKELEQHVYRIVEARERYLIDKTLADIYDPDKMPDDLRQAHRDNDAAVERMYRKRPFESDEERLAHLFKLYEEMIAAEKVSGTLFEGVKKGKKK